MNRAGSGSNGSFWPSVLPSAAHGRSCRARRNEVQAKAASKTATPNAAPTSHCETSRVHARIALCSHASASTAKIPATTSWNVCLSVSQKREKPPFAAEATFTPALADPFRATSRAVSRTRLVTAMSLSYRIGRIALLRVLPYLSRRPVTVWRQRPHSLLYPT
jgi:hypothetical protein